MLILGDNAHTYLKICLNEVLSKIGCGAAMVDCGGGFFYYRLDQFVKDSGTRMSCGEYDRAIWWIFGFLSWSAIDNSGNDTPLFFAQFITREPKVRSNCNL